LHDSTQETPELLPAVRRARLPCYNVASMAPLTQASRPRPLTIALVAASVVLIFFWRLGAVPLTEPDEGRYTEVPREMLARGDLVTPRLDGVLYFEKPALVYWLGAAAIRVFGLNEFAARFWMALFAVLGVAVVWRLGRAIGGPRVGLLAAGALATMPLYLAVGRLVTLDMTLTFFITLALACVWFAHRGGEGTHRTFWYAAFVAAALATLAKGLIGIVIPAAVAGIYIVLTRQWRVLTRVPWLTGGALFLLVAAPWHVLAAGRNPDFLQFYFVHEHFLRYATASADRQEGWWYFIAIIVGGCLPWSGLLPGVVRARRGETEERRHGRIFLLTWFVFVVVFFTLSQSKLVPYVLPALPPFAVLAALTLDEISADESRRRWLTRAGLVCAGVLVAAIGGVLIWAGLGLLDRDGLRGECLPVQIVGGLVLVVAALIVVVAAFTAARRWRAVLSAAGIALALALLSLGPLIARGRTSAPVAAQLRPRLRADDLVFAYGCFPTSLPVYLEREIGVVDYPTELAFGMSHLSQTELAARFPTVAQFRTLWDGDRRVFVVATANGLGRLEHDALPHATRLWQDTGYVLVCNRSD
jgi:4-amino-4-deoxy-L-arabinose transferase-like glycosyltransferase